jgi:uncharacterized protein (DUF952 family)
MVLHVCAAHEWQKCAGLSHYEPASYVTEKFIHCCLDYQLAGVLERYFRGQMDLYLLTIDETKLEPELLYERSIGEEKFPHVYGPINMTAIVKVEKLSQVQK